jgi:hypothetical protein
MGGSVGSPDAQGKPFPLPSLLSTFNFNLLTYFPLPLRLARHQKPAHLGVIQAADKIKYGPEYARIVEGLGNLLNAAVVKNPDIYEILDSWDRYRQSKPRFDCSYRDLFDLGREDFHDIKDFPRIFARLLQGKSEQANIIKLVKMYVNPDSDNEQILQGATMTISSPVRAKILFSAIIRTEDGKRVPYLLLRLVYGSPETADTGIDPCNADLKKGFTDEKSS